MTIYLPASGITISDYNKHADESRYEGITLNNTVPDGLLNIQNPTIILVSGTGGNPFGHALFMISRSIGYVHAADPGTHKVRFIPHDRFQDYITAWGKERWNQIPVKLSNLTGAKNYIGDCLLRGFYWSPLHNCLTFCSEILAAGDSAADSCVFPSTANKSGHAIKQPKAQHPWDAIGDADL